MPESAAGPARPDGHKKALFRRRALESRYMQYKTAGRAYRTASAYSVASTVSTVSTASTGTSKQEGAASATVASSSMPSSASFMR